MTELKPCPFCGGESELTTRRVNSGRTLYRYRCASCHAAIGHWHGGISGHEWTAAEAWNTRADDYRQAAEYWQRMYEESRANADSEQEKDVTDDGDALTTRTCHNDKEAYRDFFSGYYFVCSECGWSIPDVENLGILVACYMIKLCPNCGAKVVSGDD